MIKVFDRSGIQFRYPHNWLLETEDSDTGWVASLSSPATAFTVFNLQEDEDDPSRLTDAALAAMRETYPDLEAEATMGTIARQPALGYDIQFFALDLTNTCWIRCLQAPQGCLLILSQCTDKELDTYQSVLLAILASVEVEEV